MESKHFQVYDNSLAPTELEIRPVRSLLHNLMVMRKAKVLLILDVYVRNR